MIIKLTDETNFDELIIISKMRVLGKYLMIPNMGISKNFRKTFLKY